MSEKFFPVFEKVINQAYQLKNFTEEINHKNRIETIEPKSGPSKIKHSCYYCGEPDHISRNRPLLKSGLLYQV